MKIEVHLCSVDDKLVLLTAEDIAYYILMGEDVYDFTVSLDMDSEFIEEDDYFPTKENMRQSVRVGV
jgi:hypothetical protein